MTAPERRWTAVGSGILLGLTSGVIAHDVGATDNSFLAFTVAGFALGGLVSATIADDDPPDTAEPVPTPGEAVGEHDRL